LCPCRSKLLRQLRVSCTYLCAHASHYLGSIPSIIVSQIEIRSSDLTSANLNSAIAVALLQRAATLPVLLSSTLSMVTAPTAGTSQAVADREAAWVAVDCEATMAAAAADARAAAIAEATLPSHRGRQTGGGCCARATRGHSRVCCPSHRLFTRRVCYRSSTSSSRRRCLLGILRRSGPCRGHRFSCSGRLRPQRQGDDPCLPRQSFTTLQQGEDPLPQHTRQV
jgi:hypothetical protein